MIWNLMFINFLYQIAGAEVSVLFILSQVPWHWKENVG